MMAVVPRRVDNDDDNQDDSDELQKFDISHF